MQQFSKTWIGSAKGERLGTETECRAERMFEIEEN